MSVLNARTREHAYVLPNGMGGGGCAVGGMAGDEAVPVVVQ